MSYLSILSLFTLIMVLYVIQTETDKVMTRIAVATNAVKQARSTITEPFYSSVENPTMCTIQNIDPAQVRVEHLLEEYDNFATHVQNTLNASHRHDALAALQRVYKVNL